MTTRGWIQIESLEIECVIGVNDDERDRTQPIIVDCLLEYGELPGSEAIEEAIDYTAVSETIRHVAVEGRFYLLERLAAAVAEELLAAFPAAAQVELTARKPEALEGTAVPSVRVEAVR